MKFISLGLISLVTLIMIFNPFSSVAGSDKILTIELNGVESSKITVISIAEGKNSTIKEIPNLSKGNKVEIKIEEKYLPGEFIIFFEFMDRTQQRPQTAEKMIIINTQNVSFYANPIHINNPDSSHFDKNDIENNALTEFAQIAVRNMEMIELIQELLNNYDNKNSDFYISAIEEFETRRNEHNSFIKEQRIKYKNAYCSNMFGFYYISAVDWSLSINQRQQNLIDNYFEGMDFSNKDLLRVSFLKQWMDSYVNKYVELATSPDMIEDLFVLAGKTAIEKAKQGDPYVYGWMVDYFFNGYEIMNIQAGISMLSQYVNDPNCKTYKRKEIEKRLTGIQTLTTGTIAPDFSFTDESGKPQTLHKHKTNKAFKLIIFWSADCEHCEQTINELFSFHSQNSNTLEVYALSLDESETEIPVWKNRIKQLPGWTHILTKGGINSKEAEAYYILSSPTMFLVDAKSNKIISSPNSAKDLIDEIKQ